MSCPMDDEVLYRVDDGVAVITLNRPERLNAWTPPLQTQYFDRLAQASARRFTGSGSDVVRLSPYLARKFWHFRASSEVAGRL